MPDMAGQAEPHSSVTSAPGATRVVIASPPRSEAVSASRRPPSTTDVTRGTLGVVARAYVEDQPNPHTRKTYRSQLLPVIKHRAASSEPTSASLAVLMNDLKRTLDERDYQKTVKRYATALRHAGYRSLAATLRPAEPPRKTRSARLQELARDALRDIRWDLGGRRGRGYYGWQPQVYTGCGRCSEFCGQAVLGRRIFLGSDYATARVTVIRWLECHDGLGPIGPSPARPIEDSFARAHVYFHPGGDMGEHPVAGFYGDPLTCPMPECECDWCAAGRAGRPFYLAWNSFDTSAAGAAFQQFHHWLLTETQHLSTQLRRLACALARPLAPTIARPATLPISGRSKTEALRAIAGDSFAELGHDPGAGGFTGVPVAQSGCYCYSCEAGLVATPLWLGNSAELAASEIRRLQRFHQERASWPPPADAGMREAGMRYPPAAAGLIADRARQLGFELLLEQEVEPAETEAVLIDTTARSVGLLVVVFRVAGHDPIRADRRPAAVYHGGRLRFALLTGDHGSAGAHPLPGGWNPVTLAQLFGAAGSSVGGDGYERFAAWCSFGDVTAHPGYKITLANDTRAPCTVWVWWRGQ